MKTCTVLFHKIREAFISVFPVALIVVILNFTPLVNFTVTEIVAFSLSAFALVLGIGLFNLGADLAMTPMGEHIGAGLTKSKSMLLLVAVAFLMGLLITVAEPDLTLLAEQVEKAISPRLLILSVGVGVALFLVLSILKITLKRSLSQMLLLFYMLLFAMAALVLVNGNDNFLAVGFDSGGVTTGPITVPFIMALGVGVAATIGGKHMAENSFGLIALCSVGPILAVMALGAFSSGSLPYEVPDYSIKLGHYIPEILLETVLEVLPALGLIILFFIVLQVFVLHLPKQMLVKIAVGILYTFLGLVIFLSAVAIGFMPIGYKMGTQLAEQPRPVLVAAGFILGMVVVLAEPAVHVLKRQVSDITDGAVSQKSMMIALSIGVGISIALSMLRIIFDFSILYILIPGYFLSLALSFFVPSIYTAIAFDSGGVASGPLTSSFILPFAVGACYVLQGEAKIMADAFGIVAFVAMTPLITIQILGFRSIATAHIRKKIAMKRILDSDDEQIIEFM